MRILLGAVLQCVANGCQLGSSGEEFLLRCLFRAVFLVDGMISSLKSRILVHGHASVGRVPFSLLSEDEHAQLEGREHCGP